MFYFYLKLKYPVYFAANTPKYGLLFHSSFIGRASTKNKGRISRFLANKCTVASRIDCFADVPVATYGEHLKQQVWHDDDNNNNYFKDFIKSSRFWRSSNEIFEIKIFEIRLKLIFNVIVLWVAFCLPDQNDSFRCTIRHFSNFSELFGILGRRSFEVSRKWCNSKKEFGCYEGSDRRSSYCKNKG